METIRRILERNGVPLGQSIYEESPMLDFPISTPGAWETVPESMENDTCAKVRACRAYIRARRDGEEYRALCERIAKAPPEEKYLYRSRKKELDRELQREAFAAIFPEADFSRPIQSAAFEQWLTAIDFRDISSCVPGWRGEAYQSLCRHPWFSGDVEKLVEALKSGREIGVEGGCCLLGSDDMIFHFRTRDGNRRSFDFNTMREIREGAPGLEQSVSRELWDFLAGHAPEVEAAWLDCPKERVTIDEYEMTENLFLLASGIGAKLVITIPDFSYEKTFLNVFTALPEAIFAPLAEEYHRQVRRVRALILRLIHGMQKRYRYENVAILHGGDEELVRIFSEGRDRHIDAFTARRAYARRGITNREMARDAIRDYICMPAMPYYLWGVRDVIEVNRVEEWPSMPKCRRMHRPGMTLHTLLYPQRVSLNGCTTSFFADRYHKEYVDEEAVFAE